MIACKNIYGENKLISKEKFVFRPSVYAIIVNHDKILLVNTHSTGKYFFPGGAIEIGESMETALQREVREETGLEIEVSELFQFRESFFYNDPEDEAYHVFAFIFIGKPKTMHLIDDHLVNDGEAEKPRWVNIRSLKVEDFQSFAGEIFDHYCRTNEVVMT